MEEKIYYTKIIFEKINRCKNEWSILLNVESKEAAFQRFQWSGRKEKVVESFSKKLTDQDIADLLPYINALDFEPYRDIDDSKDWFCYDNYSLKFTGITNSYIPLYQHYVYLNYNRKDMRPYEKLYSYIINKILVV